MSVLIKPFSELGATNKGQRVDAGQRFARRHDPRTHRPAGRTSAARPFDANTYRRRSVVEHPTNRLKQWRGIATRYDKLACRYQAAVTLVGALLWFNKCARQQSNTDQQISFRNR
jgi:hypothetical protein